MSLSQFSDAQRDFYLYTSTIDLENDEVAKSDQVHTPFVKLLGGHESSEMVEKRWDLYHQLYYHFHDHVDGILANIEKSLGDEISAHLMNEDPGIADKPCFNTIFLIGSDSSVKIDVHDDIPGTFTHVMDLSPKESPNVRMMLRRCMFKLYSASAEMLPSNKVPKFEIGDDIPNEDGVDIGGSVSYDLSFVEEFKELYSKNLFMIFNLKDVDSMNPSTLNSFVLLLSNALRYDHVRIGLVFNINTNMSNLQKNLNHSTIRLLKRKFHVLDVSSNKGYKYGNRIFQGFLDTVDSKLNLSSRFVQFILDKMSNNSNHNLQLLTKILDYALMSYFYQNPFSVFIDPVNIVNLNEHYLKLLTHCPTLMFFLEGLIEENAPVDELQGLLSNTNNMLSDFFTEFLVRENPINGHAKYVASYLENELAILNYNFVELYHHLLIGDLDTYLNQWPRCRPHIEKLKFDPIDTIFQELFTLDNNNGLLSQAMFPFYKSNLENSLLNWGSVLPPLSSKEIKKDDWLSKLNKLMGPPVSQLFKLYREAGYTISLYDFYIAFKATLPETEIKKLLELEEDNSKIKSILHTKRGFDKIALVLFMQAVNDFNSMGIVKSDNKGNYEVLEKWVWRGV